MRDFTLLESVVVTAIIAVLETLNISTIDRYDVITRQTQYRLQYNVR